MSSRSTQNRSTRYRWWRRLFALLAIVVASSCLPHHGPKETPPPPTVQLLTPAQVASLIPSHVPDRPGWARDIFAALESHDIEATPKNIASILAIIEQESNFQANPPVPGVARMVERRLHEYASKLGPLGPPAVRALLRGKVPGTDQTFEARLQQVKNERDLDRFFRDLLTYYQTEYPTTFATANLLGGLFASQRLEDFNPITTAGSMQVSVRFAEELAEATGRDPRAVREELYTRRGGVYYGIARLMDYEASYSQPLYRFADYNAGRYASRNAALQAQVSRLTGMPLVTDGDLLAYNKQGKPLDTLTNSLKAALAFRLKYAPDLSEARVRKDLEKEKTRAFEQTETWKAVKRTFERVTGGRPDYARLPEVTISSPKLKGDRSTAWFARSVEKRFQKFYGRSQAIAAK